MRGIDVDAAGTWIAGNVAGVVPPLRFEPLPHAASNLAHRVTDAAGRALVVRHPPPGPVAPGAHDVRREHRVLEALAPTPVPVPAPLAFCADDAVAGVPFSVTAHVEGHVLRDVDTVESTLDEDGRRRASESLVEVLARLHAVDVEGAGLGDLGPGEAYVERQLARWYGEFQHAQELAGRGVLLIHEMHRVLSARIPEQGPPALLHGDYRFDNVVVGDDGAVRAVTGWEACSVGDPLVELGLLLVYWTDPGDDRALGMAPTALPGFLTRRHLEEAYAARSGRDLSQLGFYLAFGYWKLACILESVYARQRARARASGEDDGALHAFAHQVVRLAEASKDAAGWL